MLEGLECVSDKKYKFLSSTEEHPHQLHIHILHEPAHVDSIKAALETVGLDYVIVTYDSESSAINRKTGPRTAKQLALEKNILLREFSIDTVALTSKCDFISVLENLTLYVSNGGSSSDNSQMKEAWSRYLHASANIKLYQRLFFNFGVIRGKSNALSLQTPELYENVPVSLKNLQYTASIDQRMKKATTEQSELWCKISADWAWQKSNVER